MSSSNGRCDCFKALLCPAVLALAAALQAAVSSGYPTYPQTLPNADSVPCPPERSGECEADGICKGVGHINCKGGSVKAPDGEFLNPFGKAFAANGYKWTQDLCEADSDGDGVPNGVELGDPCCIWSTGMASAVDADYVISHPGDSNADAAGGNTLPTADECAALADSTPGAGTADENLVDAMYNDGEDRIELKFMAQNHTLLPNETMYTNFYFNAPMDQAYHVVGALPHIDNVKRTHHFILYLCQGSLSDYTDKEEGVANNPATPETNGDVPPTCLETLFIWAPGVASMELPSDTAYELGSQTPYASLMLEVHYNNVDGVSDETDASGLTLYATSAPRAKSAGWLWTGSVDEVGTIPPGVEQYFSNQQCIVELTPECEHIEVLAFTPHAHFLGTAVWAEHYTSDEAGKPQLVGDLGVDYAFSYENQASRYFDSPRIVKSGDSISTTCMYDAGKMTTATVGGLASQDEMCIAFLLYTNKECVHSIFCSGIPVSGPWPSGTDFDTPGSSAAIVPIATLPDFDALVSSGALECDVDAVAEPSVLEALETACLPTLLKNGEFVTPEQALEKDCGESCVDYYVNLGVCMVSELKGEYQELLKDTEGVSPWSYAPPQCVEAVNDRVRPLLPEPSTESNDLGNTSAAAQHTFPGPSFTLLATLLLVAHVAVRL